MPLQHTVETIELENGLRGLLINVPGADIVSYECIVRAGYGFDLDENLFETPHLLEHILSGWNTEFEKKSDFNKAIKKNAAYVNASTGPDTVCYVGDCVADEWLRVLRLRKIALLQPKFSAEAIKAESGNVREELSGNTTNNRRIAFISALKALGIRYDLDTVRIDNVQHVTASMLQGLYDHAYTARNMQVIIAGDIHAKKTEMLSELASWQLPLGEQLSVSRNQLNRKKSTTYSHDGTAMNVAFYLTFGLGRQLSQKEIMVAEILRHMLVANNFSRILGTARDLGICYGMDNETLVWFDHISAWSFTGVVSIDNAKQLFRLIVNELRKLVQQELSAADVTAEKEYARGLYTKSGQTTERLIDLYRERYIYRQNSQHIDETRDAIDQITADDIVGFVQEFLTSDSRVLSLVTRADDADELQRDIEHIVTELDEV